MGRILKPFTVITGWFRLRERQNPEAREAVCAAPKNIVRAETGISLPLKDGSCYHSPLMMGGIREKNSGNGGRGNVSTQLAEHTLAADGGRVVSVGLPHGGTGLSADQQDFLPLNMGRRGTVGSVGAGNQHGF